MGREGSWGWGYGCLSKLCEAPPRRPSWYTRLPQGPITSTAANDVILRTARAFHFRSRRASRTCKPGRVNVLALAIAGLAFLASAYAVIAGEVRAHRTRRQKLALGPAPEAARDAIEHARAAFQEIMTLGGRDLTFFFDEQQKYIPQSLRDNADRQGSEALKDALQRVADTWQQAFARAPIASESRYSPDPEQAERDRQMFAVAELPHRGLEECTTALARLNAEQAGSDVEAVQAACPGMGTCRRQGTDAFFPEQGESTETAKAICDGCEVRSQCLSAALGGSAYLGGLGRAVQSKPAAAAAVGGVGKLPAKPE